MSNFFTDQESSISTNSDRVLRRNPEIQEPVWTERLNWLFAEPRAAVTDFIIGILSLLGYILFILDCYQLIVMELLFAFDIVLLILYSLFYVLKMLTHQHPLLFIFNIHSIVDFLLTAPLILTFFGKSGVYQLLQISRSLRVMLVARIVHKRYHLNRSYDMLFSVDRQIFLIFLTVITFVLVSSGVMFVLEGQNFQQNFYQNPEILTFHFMIYFVFVVMSTVGYGDFQPATVAGKFFLVVMIVTIIIIIPKQTNQLIHLLNIQSRYSRAVYKSDKNSSFLLVCGEVGVSALTEFCRQLFHPDHGSNKTNVVILNQKIPDAEMESFLNDPDHEQVLYYLQGSALIQTDLQRAAVGQASMVMLMTTKHSQETEEFDHRIILTALAIKKYVFYLNGRNIRIAIQLINPVSKEHYFSTMASTKEDHILAIQQFKMNLLAKSCFCPGIISLVCNLIKSANQAAYNCQDWITQYNQGRLNQIYRVALSARFTGKTFSEMAAEVFDKLNAIVIGMEYFICNHHIIRLNPGLFRIRHDQFYKPFVYVICGDKDEADKISTDLDEESLAADRFNENTEMNMMNIVEYSENMSVQEQVVLQVKSQVSMQMKNHVIVCGMHKNLINFVKILRAKELSEFQPIVVLNLEQDKLVLEQLNRFSGVIFFKGSPLQKDDLIGAGISTAGKAVILASNDYEDSQLIFIYKAIKKMNEKVQVFIEIVNSSSIQFLMANNTQKDGFYQTSPLFAAGEVYFSTSIDTLLCQSYFNQHIINILEQIIAGRKPDPEKVRKVVGQELANFNKSNLWQIEVPEDFVNKTFGELLNYFTIQRNIIPIALYRLKGALANLTPYTYTKPHPSTKLTQNDRIFILASQTPKDLFFRREQPSSSYIPRSSQSQYQNQCQQNARSRPQRGESIAQSPIFVPNIKNATLEALVQIERQLGNICGQLKMTLKRIEEQNEKLIQQSVQMVKEQMLKLMSRGKE